METEDSKSSLVEQQETQRTQSVAFVAQLTGTIMLGVLVTLGCGYAGVLILGFVGFLFGMLLLYVRLWLGWYDATCVGDGCLQGSAQILYASTLLVLLLEASTVPSFVVSIFTKLFRI